MEEGDLAYMRRALSLAIRGRFTTAPNPNVGCVVVRDGQVVGEGYHQRAGKAHAEIVALRMAGDAAFGATVYITLEPCNHYGRTPPCVDALIAAGVARVVVAMPDPNPLVSGRGLQRLCEAGIAIFVGLSSDESEQINRGYIKRMRTGFPYVQLKLAASLDGKSAMASGESQWITSSASRQDVQSFRAESSAILSTSATVLADDPMLTVRWDELDAQTQSDYPREALRLPIRVVIDSQNRLMPEQRLFHQPGEIWLVRSAERVQVWPLAEIVTPLILPRENGHIDLLMLMMELAKREINTVWVEAGAHLAGGLLRAGLVDELILYIAPKLLGHEANPLCYLPALHFLSDAPQFKIVDVAQIGPDLRLRLIAE